MITVPQLYVACKALGLRDCELETITIIELCDKIEQWHKDRKAQDAKYLGKLLSATREPFDLDPRFHKDM